MVYAGLVSRLNAMALPGYFPTVKKAGGKQSIRLVDGACSAAFVFCALFLTHAIAADRADEQSLSLTISDGSVRIKDIELRIDPPTAERPFLSLEAAEKALGSPQDNRLAGVGVRDYGWRDLGIHLQRGLRGPEKGKIFKFQVWLTDYYDEADHRHSGTFKGYVHLHGIDIGPETTFDQIRDDLRKTGYAVGDYSGVKSADKGEISVFTISGTSSKLQRIEVWCRQ